ncbi:MAG: hypothetical protein V2J08_07495, partial [Desulfotignum sp.]|nr:hypothetical protein [Desulfotignum sp.]
LSDSQIEAILQRDPIQEAGRQLLCTALEMGGKDNVTVIVSEFFSANFKGDTIIPNTGRKPSPGCLNSNKS